MMPDHAQLQSYISLLAFDKMLIIKFGLRRQPCISELSEAFSGMKYKFAINTAKNGLITPSKF
jgi:hypothetical protein